MATTIKVNGVDRTVDVDGDTPLLWVLRDVLGMTGTKFGCGMALCGACTVHVDGVATRSGITPIDGIRTSEITTIEAIGATAAGVKIQKAWLDGEVVQCWADNGWLTTLIMAYMRLHERIYSHPRCSPQRRGINN